MNNTKRNIILCLSLAACFLLLLLQRVPTTDRAWLIAPVLSLINIFATLMIFKISEKKSDKEHLTMILIAKGIKSALIAIAFFICLSFELSQYSQAMIFSFGGSYLICQILLIFTQSLKKTQLLNKEKILT